MVSNQNALLQKVRDVAIEASLAVADIYNTGDFTVSDKGEEGPLTSADLLANTICKERLTELLPAAGWLSEESVDDSSRLARDYLWVVDPIDGTREFVNHTPEFSISIGLAHRGIPILGAVALPAENRVIYGSPESGVRVAHIGGGVGGDPGSGILKEEAPALSPVPGIPSAKILVSASEWRKGKYKDFPPEFHFEPGGSIARKLALLAAGEGDMVVSLYPKNDWDICGGSALVLSVPGYRVLELEHFEGRIYNGADTKSYGLVAGPSNLIEEFLDYFRKNGLVVERKYG